MVTLSVVTLLVRSPEYAGFIIQIRTEQVFLSKKNGTANWQVIKVGLKESFIEGFTTRKMSKGTGCMCPLVPVFFELIPRKWYQ